MTIHVFRFIRGALSVGTAAIVLSGCSVSKSQNGTLPLGASVSSSRSASRVTSSSYDVVYRFGRYKGDGEAFPYGGLVALNGTLYGTDLGDSTHRDGAVYSISPSGTKKTVYGFHGKDGSRPEAGLLDVDGILYGTTYNGGKYASGVVFSLTTKGVETILHDFTGGKTDGAGPTTPLVNVNGTLYGTTEFGGVYDCYSSMFACGTVYSISTGGSEKMLHAFGIGDDGKNPEAPLVDVNGKLYGTTIMGGTDYADTVYTIDANGSEKVVYSFKEGSTDGHSPQAPLIEVKGKLYGTTAYGGKAGYGTVYSISATGSESVLYSFTGAPDGWRPVAGLLDLKGVLYGTTVLGGQSNCDAHSRYNGCGIIFSITTGGKEKVLHAFTAGADGAVPSSGLIDVAGTLYGTTSNGGFYKCLRQSRNLGCGTVFALKPSAAPWLR